MPCPNCGSKAAQVGPSYSTLMYFPTYRDASGNYYQKGHNQTTTHFTCEECGTKYTEESK